jgi:hypothetical protein
MLLNSETVIVNHTHKNVATSFVSVVHVITCHINNVTK